MMEFRSYFDDGKCRFFCIPCHVFEFFIYLHFCIKICNLYVMLMYKPTFFSVQIYIQPHFCILPLIGCVVVSYALRIFGFEFLFTKFAFKTRFRNLMWFTMDKPTIISIQATIFQKIITMLDIVSVNKFAMLHDFWKCYKTFITKSTIQKVNYLCWNYVHSQQDNHIHHIDILKSFHIYGLFVFFFIIICFIL